MGANDVLACGEIIEQMESFEVSRPAKKGCSAMMCSRVSMAAFLRRDWRRGGRRSDGADLLGNINAYRTPRDAAAAAHTPRAAKLVNPGSQLVGHPLPVSRLGGAANTAAVNVREVLRETGMTSKREVIPREGLPTIQPQPKSLKFGSADDPSYSNPRCSGYLACKELTRSSNWGWRRRFFRLGSFKKNGQHAKPVSTLRSSHANATSG